MDDSPSFVSISRRTVWFASGRGKELEFFIIPQVRHTVPYSFNLNRSGLVYAGPQFDFTWGWRLSAELAADLPISRSNSGTQVVPDYRIRAAVTFRF